MSVDENKQNLSDQDTENRENYKSGWHYIIRGMWRSPLGLMGVAITTVSITLMLVGLALDVLGLIHNPYAAMATYLLLPGGMVTGLLLIPIAAFVRRRRWRKYGIARDHLHINLSDHKHRRWLVGFIALTVINLSILVVIAYEGYHFTDSSFFCGRVCHTVMEPEYAVYQRSPHVKVKCVECHIGPGADWFVRAKISGLRQVAAVMAGSYSRPIPAPVEHLRPARDTCEECHWPDKFHGKKIKIFQHFSNEDQTRPEVTEIALHIGGRNPQTDAFEGIHWHVSKDVQVSYLAADAKRTQIARVKVTRPDGSHDEFVKEDIDVAEDETHEWRIMDCIDCHNRPTHIYQMPEEVIDAGLLSRKINPDVPGIREDGLAVLTKEYESREAAQEIMVRNLVELQKKRDPAKAKQYAADIKRAGEYLLAGYLGNVWPAMNVLWGTYGKHLGHQRAEEGYGCFRCHDEEHLNPEGNSISQDCSVCHDEP
ncbi:MAG: NapC/NirT family cytochrome c [Proteobacteria bacterium]|nr:NapC/NirT family cytochrome c [Pseudomonadota bacterium]